MSNAQHPYDIPLYWLFKRDPYFMAYYYMPYIFAWVVCHPLYTANNKGLGFCSYNES